MMLVSGLWEMFSFLPHSPSLPREKNRAVWFALARVGLCVGLVIWGSGTFAHAQGQKKDGKSNASPSGNRHDDINDDAERAPAGVYVNDLLEALPAEGGAIRALDVDNRLGDVRIVGHDGRGLAIFAVKHAPDAKTIERLEVKLIQDPRGQVSIRTQIATTGSMATLKKGAVRIDLVVRVPRSAHVTATVWNGKLRIKKVDNGVDAVANEGPIHLREVSGLITSESASGDQRFEQIVGDLETRSIEGDVAVDGLRGKRLAAVVKSGMVTARGVRVQDMLIRVIKGDIHLEADVIAGGRYTVMAINGNVHAKISATSRVRVSASSRRGRLRLPKRFAPQKSSANSSNQVVGYLGEGGSPAHLSLRSSTGNVVLAQF